VKVNVARLAFAFASSNSGTGTVMLKGD